MSTDDFSDGLMAEGYREQAKVLEPPMPEGQQRIDIGELLLTMKHVIEKMSVRNMHRGVITTAGSVIIHLVTENQRLSDRVLDLEHETTDLALALEHRKAWPLAPDIPPENIGYSDSGGSCDSPPVKLVIID